MVNAIVIPSLSRNLSPRERTRRLRSSALVAKLTFARGALLLGRKEIPRHARNDEVGALRRAAPGAKSGAGIR